ncbi:MAG: hypothetical protein A2X86_21215 [Bdellovibrionales bacterium GWA2_49_15]|nr:MAG: hypothetical protein A2X86_21215 [Bdellovibrionales bacterium GWA2_49_15]
MKTILIFLFLLMASRAFGQVKAIKSFEEIWQSFSQKSSLIQAAREERESSSLAFDRANRHWLPKAYVSGQIFSSDDPGQVFFNNLGQRSITAADFNPTVLNNPEREVYQTGTIGLQLPLYEGGSRVAQSSMMDLILQARVLEIEARKTQEYGELSRHYGYVVISSKAVTDLAHLKAELSKVMASYQVGAKSNPVGFSGLLGLKAVHNRIVGLNAKFLLEVQSKKDWIGKKAAIEGDWVPDLGATLHDYLDKNLPASTSNPNSSVLLANAMEVNALAKMKEVESARFLPQVGLFAQHNVYSGARDFQGSQTFGINVTWDLFNPDSYGRVAEAQAKHRASEAKIAAARQDELIARQNLVATKGVLDENLKLLSDTERLLEEQTANAMKLFRSGPISALQLSEVINRRVDLIENKAAVENQYLEVMANIFEIYN